MFVQAMELDEPSILNSNFGCDSSRQRRLAMVHVTDRAHVHVGLGAFEFTFCHHFDSEKAIPAR